MLAVVADGSTFVRHELSSVIRSVYNEVPYLVIIGRSAVHAFH